MAPDLRPDADGETLAAAVRRRRRQLRLTQEELSDLAEVGVRLVHEVEHGRESIRLDKLVSLLSALGLHLELAPGAATGISTRTLP